MQLSNQILTWENIPTPILEKIFLNLSWRDRSRAALTCKTWLNAFLSPSLWRSITYVPPNKRLTRVQYDIFTYRMAKCFKIIGWHIREYRFPKTPDFFMLNRILCLLADFLEMHSSIPIKISETELLKQTNSSFNNERDPDLKKTLKLAKKLQDIDLMNDDSDDYEIESSSSSTLSLPELQENKLTNKNELCNECMSIYAGTVLKSEKFDRKQSFGLPPPKSRFERNINKRQYQRSHSCKFVSFESNAQQRQQLIYPPDTYNYISPKIIKFRLFFNCEFDEIGGLTYGSGGALLATLIRVINRLHGLKDLDLVDLFLTVNDARQLIDGVVQIAGETIESLNLTNLSKLISLSDIERINNRTWQDSEEFSLSSSSLLDNLGGDLLQSPHRRWWFLKEVRWLQARPKYFSWNPLSDIASRFKNLRYLTLSISQLTSAMLMRLIYQTPLSRIILVRNDFTSLHHFLPRRTIQELDSIDQPDDENFSGQIDWTLEVPSIKNHGNSFDQETFEEIDWQPISNIVWKEALNLSPELRVTFRIQLSRWRSIEQDLPIQIWPRACAPVDIVEIFIEATNGPLILAQKPFQEILSLYSSSLSHLFLFFNKNNGNEPGTSIRLSTPNQISNNINNFHGFSYPFGPINVDKWLFDPLLQKLTKLQSLAIGGDRVCVSEHALIDWLSSFKNILKKLELERFCLETEKENFCAITNTISQLINQKQWCFKDPGSVQDYIRKRYLIF